MHQSQVPFLIAHVPKENHVLTTSIWEIWHTHTCHILSLLAFVYWGFLWLSEFSSSSAGAIQCVHVNLQSLRVIKQGL
jgi:hypothetical protein